jgi:hypothetical protein
MELDSLLKFVRHFVRDEGRGVADQNPLYCFCDCKYELSQKVVSLEL